MNSKSSRILAIALSGVLLGSGTAVAALNSEKTAATDNTKTEAVQTDAKDEVKNGKTEKDETVYVIAGADGSVKKIIVSDWIKNGAGLSTIKDTGKLNNVKNVKGNETYTMDKDNMRVWNADGNDIYSQGEITDTLPVDLSVSYKLDGETISPSELVGKSGKVTMRFDYENNQYEYVTIDGKQEKIYVPFLMLSGMMLDSSKFTNVSVTNGKIIGDGEKTVVVGIALPGLGNNLKIKKDEFDIPDYIEITADVTDFELETTMTLATNEALNSLDLSKVDSLNSLNSEMKTLTDSMKQLLDGSSMLYNGMQTLLVKCDVLAAGINKLGEGAKQVSGGAAEVSGGVSQVRTGLNSAYENVKNQLTSNNKNLTDGALQIYNSILSTVRQQIIAGGISTVPELTPENYSASLTAVENGMKQQVIDGVKNGVLQNVLAANGMTVGVYNALPAGNAVKDSIDGAVATAMQGDEAKAAVNTNMETYGVNAGIAKIEAGRAQLDSYNKFYNGLVAYTEGVSTVEQGLKNAYDDSAKLESGAAQVADGAKQVSDGIGEVQAKTPELKNGVKKLTDGSMTLNNGLNEFNEKGVQKLVDAVDGDIGGLVARLKATVDVSKDYTSFTGTADGTEGNVKFIYKTDSIKK